MTAAVPERGADDFRALTDPHVRELHLHCYRMLGSVDDADDILQETLLAAWQGMATFAGLSSLRTWLYRIATNRCLNAIRNGSRRPPAAPIPPFDPPPPSAHHHAPWIQPYLTADPAYAHERREHLELAFVTALQTMPPRQTAALLLVDVLGFSLAEAAQLLEEGATSVKGLLQRARRSVRDRDGGQPRPAPDAERRMAEQFAAAFAADDIDGVLALLTDQAWLAMPPAPHLYRGRVAIRAFLEASIGWRRGSRSLSLQSVSCNAAPAYTIAMSGPEGWQPAGVAVLEIAPEGITGITRFLSDRAGPEAHEHRR